MAYYVMNTNNVVTQFISNKNFIIKLNEFRKISLNTQEKYNSRLMNTYKFNE